MRADAPAVKMQKGELFPGCRRIPYASPETDRATRESLSFAPCGWYVFNTTSLRLGLMDYQY